MDVRFKKLIIFTLCMLPMISVYAETSPTSVSNVQNYFTCFEKLRTSIRLGIPVPTASHSGDIYNNANVTEFITPLGSPVFKSFIFQSQTSLSDLTKNSRDYITLDAGRARLCTVLGTSDKFVVKFNGDNEQVRIEHKKSIGPDERNFIKMGSASTLYGLPVRKSMDGNYNGPNDRQYVRFTPTKCDLVFDSCYLDRQPRCEDISLNPATALVMGGDSTTQRNNVVRGQLEIALKEMLERKLSSLTVEEQKTFTARENLKGCQLNFIDRAITDFKFRNKLVIGNTAPSGNTATEQ